MKNVVGVRERERERESCNLRISKKRRNIGRYFLYLVKLE